MKKIICTILSMMLILSSAENMKVYAESSVDGDINEIEMYEDSGIIKETAAEPEKIPDASPDTPETPENTLHVLMIGNSFTRRTANNTVYSVGQPLEELAAGEGHKLEVTTLVYSGSYLRRYAGLNPNYISYYTRLMALLVNEKWDYIVLQEQSKCPIEHFDDYTYPAVEKLLQMIKTFQPQATPLLYMTHGYNKGTTTKVNGISKVLEAKDMQIYLAAAYRTLEHKLNVEAVPSGMQFIRANYFYPRIEMLGSDSWHPSWAGYYLSACSFYQRIYGTTPDPTKASLTNCNLTERELISLAALTSDSMILDKTDIRLAVGETVSLNASVSSQHLNEVTYKSLDEKVAHVDKETGKVTAKEAGSTVIMASTPDGLQAFCNVTVKQPLYFARSYYLAGIGDLIQIMPQTNAENLKWSSKNKNVATVSGGIVTAKASGKTVITVTNQDDDTDQASYELYVTCGTPGELKAASAGNPAENAAVGKIKISWSTVAGASGYDIYRSTSKNGVYSLIGSSKTISYIDAQAKVNTQYYYKVTAKNNYVQCTSALSSSTRGIILKATSLKTKRTSKKYAKLTWQKNAKADGYVIYRSTKANSGYKKIVDLKSKTKTSYTDKNVNKNKTYYYRVKAYKKIDGKIFYGVKCRKAKIKI